MDNTVIFTKLPALDRVESQTLVERVRSSIARQWVKKDRLNFRTCKAPGEGEVHDTCAVALAQIRGLANPDVDRSQVGGHLAPVVALLLGRINDLHEANRDAIDFGNQLLASRGSLVQLGLPAPIIVGVGRDDMGLFVPTSEQRQIVDRCRS